MKRKQFLQQLKNAFSVHPIVAILGPRQCGKTTLSVQFEEVCGFTSITRLDLEDPRDLARLENPMLALEELTGLIIIDEIQRRPDLFPTLRVLADQKKKRKFLILGSASRELIRQSSESLAGRIGYIELTPFNSQETDNLKRLWFRGGYPEAYLAKSETIAQTWLKDYIRTYLEQDIPNLGLTIPPESLRKFWMMLTHYHGQIMNASEIGKSLGISHVTVQKYLDILSGTFMIRQLPGWTENIKKRQIKTPKIYFRDSGMYHHLSGIDSYAALQKHPKIGPSWEGFALEEVIRKSGVDAQSCFFWGIHNQAELDLVILKHGKKVGIEIKYTDSPTITKSMKLAMETLNLDHLNIVIPGNKSFSLAPQIKVLGLEAFHEI